MGDYEYNNGEDYINDSEFSTLVDAAYEKVDDMPSDTFVRWEDICNDYFGIEVADPSDKPAWTLHVYARNAMMGAVNHRASVYGKAWRIYIAQPGVSVVKKKGRKMVDMEIEKRMRKVGGAYSLIEKKLTPMLGVDGLSRRDRVVVSQILDVARGARLATSGMVDRLDVPKKVKRLIQQQLEISYSVDEDDE